MIPNECSVTPVAQRARAFWSPTFQHSPFTMSSPQDNAKQDDTTPPQKRGRAEAVSRSSSPPKEDDTRSMWMLPPDESFSVMNFVLQNADCAPMGGGKLVIQLLEQLPKSSAAWPSESKRWRQCFMPGVSVRVHWRGTEFEMRRAGARNENCSTENDRGLSRMLKPTAVDGLQVSSACCTWKTLNGLVRAAEDFNNKCSTNGVPQTVVLPSDDGDTVVNNVAPMVALKDVWWPDVGAKKKALAALKGLKPRGGYPARFVAGIRGASGTGKTTLVRALATETHRIHVKKAIIGKTNWDKLVVKH